MKHVSRHRQVPLGGQLPQLRTIGLTKGEGQKYLQQWYLMPPPCLLNLGSEYHRFAVLCRLVLKWVQMLWFHSVYIGFQKHVWWLDRGVRGMRLGLILGHRYLVKWVGHMRTATIRLNSWRGCWWNPRSYQYVPIAKELGTLIVVRAATPNKGGFLNFFGLK